MQVKQSVVYAILVAVPLLAAAVIASVCFAVLRAVGVVHAFGIGAGVAAIVFLANVAVLALADARSESDLNLPALEAVETVETLAVHARAS